MALTTDLTVPFDLPDGTDTRGFRSAGATTWRLLLANGRWVDCRQAAPDAPWTLTVGTAGTPEPDLAVEDVTDRLAELAAE